MGSAHPLGGMFYIQFTDTLQMLFFQSFNGIKSRVIAIHLKSAQNRKSPYLLSKCILKNNVPQKLNVVLNLCCM